MTGLQALAHELNVERRASNVATTLHSIPEGHARVVNGLVVTRYRGERFEIGGVFGENVLDLDEAALRIARA